MSKKGEARIAIERVLAKAEMPLSRAEICERSGRTADEVRCALSAMVTNGDCYTDGRRHPARYTAEPQTAPVPKLPTPRAFNYQTAPLYGVSSHAWPALGVAVTVCGIREPIEVAA